MKKVAMLNRYLYSVHHSELFWIFYRWVLVYHNCFSFLRGVYLFPHMCVNEEVLPIHVSYARQSHTEVLEAYLSDKADFLVLELYSVNLSRSRCPQIIRLEIVSPFSSSLLACQGSCHNLVSFEELLEPNTLLFGLDRLRKYLGFLDKYL